MDSITSCVRYTGVDDKTLDLFESQYAVPRGISYNSYLILDDKVAVMDTVDRRKCGEWLDKLQAALGGRAVDYLVVLHMEPDHAGSIARLAELYPDMRIVGNAKTFAFMAQFFGPALAPRAVTVAEGDTLPLGRCTLRFFLAPMVHWPEVMVAYEESDGLLFSADAFGTFGALDAQEDWLREARRYYFNIVGKYGAQVQALLKKAAALKLSAICPLHGPVLRENPGFYLEKYDVWSRYAPEEPGVLVAFASIHGHTAAAARELAGMLRAAGAPKVAVTDLARDDQSKAVEDAFRYSRLALLAASYDGGLFPPMEHFLMRLKSKGYRGRTVGLVENGTWGPTAGKVMRGYLEAMQGVTLAQPTVTLRSALNDESRERLRALAAALAAE